MPHPKDVRYAEGTYVQYNQETKQYILFSEFIAGNHEVIKDHDSIVARLSQTGLLNELEFGMTTVPYILSAFVEA